MGIDNKRSQKLDQLERDAKQAGCTVKERHIAEKRVMSQDAQVAFASALAQLYMQKQLEHMETEDITSYMALYLQCFRNGYEEVKPSSGVINLPSPGMIRQD